MREQEAAKVAENLLDEFLVQRAKKQDLDELLQFSEL